MREGIVFVGGERGLVNPCFETVFVASGCLCLKQGAGE